MGTPHLCLRPQLRCQVGNTTHHEWYYDPSSWTDPFSSIIGCLIVIPFWSNSPRWPDYALEFFCWSDAPI